jgi:hypothetical protein
LEGGLPEELTVYAQSANGTFTENPITPSHLIGKMVFTPEFAGENIVNLYTDINNKVPVTVVVAEPYTGPIYVSKDGSDSNSGKEDAPVASIAKAVELAQAGSGQIFIKEGTYNENNITINSEIPLSITGEDNVVIDGTGLGTSSMFIIKTREILLALVICQETAVLQRTLDSLCRTAKHFLGAFAVGSHGIIHKRTYKQHYKG